MNTTVTRTLSGLVFLAVMLSGFLINQYIFGALFLAMLIGMLWEFFHMNMGRQHKVPRIITMLLGAGMFATMWSACVFDSIPFKYVSLNSILVLALMVSIVLEKQQKDFRSISYLFTGIMYIAVPLSLSNLVVFRGGEFSGILMLSFFIIIWASDVGAYCFGMLLGQKIWPAKLCPSISPKKSWAGFWGGMLTALAAAAIMHYTGLLGFPLAHCLAMAAIMNVLGVFGDLFESMWKRAADVKDSGNLIPGHGGLMDRFDSALFAIPAGVLYLVIASLI